MKKAIVTWSGGKDSCFAAYLAQEQGYELKALVNSISDDYERVRFHGLSAKVIQQQAAAINLPFVQGKTRATHYTEDFTRLLTSTKDSYDAISFGDIYLDKCFDWAQNICQQLDCQLIEPLWKQKQSSLLEQFISAGFKAIIVSTQANLLGKEWLGRSINRDFINEIKKLKHIDASGENGEYHTFVYDGPLFKKRIAIEREEKILRNGYWFLDIQQTRVVNKN